LFKTSHLDNDGYFNYGSHGNKPRLQVLETPKRNISAVMIEDFISLIPDDVSKLTMQKADANQDTELVYTNPNVESKHSSRNTSGSSDDSNSSQTTSTCSGSESSDCDHNSSSEESVWDTDDDDDHDSEFDDESDDAGQDDDDDDESYSETDACYAYIKNFPVHCIALQKCDGTLDSLFSKHSLSKEEATSALMQIVMTLLCYQTTFQFTHNDLHTNNIMYVNTTKHSYITHISVKYTRYLRMAKYSN